MICIQLCFFVQSTALYTYDIIIHQILPNLLIVIFSIALLLRVCRQKYRVGQSLQWRKHWKMTIQLLFVAFIYLIFSFPITLMNFLHLCGVSRQSTSTLLEYLLVLNYCMILLCPFACASALPQLKNKIKNILQIRQQARVVAPMTRHIRNTILNQTFA
ncbi:unnamed protein product [Adineta steineri]|uniref:G-protein coupled receptors family 1 profile domain-containing protein n=1 Tax=Adineta steineri TaxID=433720 RepID=A0A814ZIV7_9BILA|nr:unnamed protein product [Adineta steineri]CAF1243882.1 unnamed protein product [Adineta steineri]